MKFSEFSDNFPSSLLDQEFESRWMSIELICYVKTIVLFIDFTTSFVCRIL